MKIRVFFALLLTLSIVGCSPRLKRVEATAVNNKQRLAENDIRLHNLEASLAHVQSRVSDLDHRSYEVRTRNGKKTGMVVVPVASQKPVPIASISSKENNKAEAGKTNVSAGHKIDPQAPPLPMAKSSIARNTPAKIPAQIKEDKTLKSIPEGGPSGRLAAQSLRPDELALPPTEMPSAEGTAPTNQPSAPGVPSTPKVVEDALGMPPVTLPVAEQGQTSAVPNAPVAPEPSRPVATPVRAQQGEDAAYKEALNLARSGRSAEGIARFESFLQNYPSGKYAPNAYFWIGECLYSQGKYQDALNQYQKVNDTYAKHHKNADALLKAGMSMKRLGNAEGATQKFQELKKSFPNSEAAKRLR